MRRILCLTVVMSALAGPALAGMNEGVAAVTVGDYPRAISEFEPLAESGNAAAQYQLAKLYLEGHGPADGVSRGVELMTKSATGNHPEAQAQLGLMYAMGLGVPVDNAKAYDWLTKAIAALPEGTRRSVAEANRDAVKMRMKPINAVASAPAPAGKATTKPPAAAPSTTAAATKTAPAKPASTGTAPAAAVTPPPAAAKPAAAKTKPATAEAKTDPATTVVAEAAKTKPATTATKTDPATTVVAEAAKTKPASTEAKAAPAAPAATVTQVASTQSVAKTADTSTQVASAKASESKTSMPNASGPASQQDVQSGVRVQVASMPSEELAWKEWKRLSGQFGTQLSGLTAIVQPADLGQKGMFYRVQTGPFESIAAAEQRCSAMKQAGLGCLVIGTP